MFETENFSFLLLILVAFALTRAKLDQGAFERIPKLLFNLCYPAVILISFAGMDGGVFGSESLFIMGFSAVYTVVFYLLTLALLRRYKRADRKDLIAFYMVANNVVFVGLPFIAYFFGGWGVRLAILFNVAQDFFIWSFCYGMFAGRGSVRQTLKVMLNPCFVAVIAGVALAGTGTSVPGLIAPPLALLADMTAPLALLCIGSLLAQNAGALRAISRDAVFAVLAKTFVLPAVVFGILTLAGVESALVTFAAFIAILPAALLSVIFSKEFGKDVAFANVLFVLSTGMFILVNVGLYLGQRAFGFALLAG